MCPDQQTRSMSPVYRTERHLQPETNAQVKQRARDLAIPFDGTPGKYNSIPDVPGIEV